MKNKGLIFSFSLLLFGGLVFSNADVSYTPAKAEEVSIQGSFINVTSIGSSSFSFQTAPNDAPSNSDSSVRYKPEAVENITITQPDGTSYHIESAITQREAVVKYSETNYSFEYWVFGGTRKPEEGDIVTLEGNFVRTDGDVVTKLNFKRSSFLITRNYNGDLYPINIPQNIYDVSEHSTGYSMSVNTWWFLFYANGLSEDYAPRTGDDYAYFPSSTECIYLDGNPIAKVGKQALRRRDPGSDEFYVSKHPEFQNFEPAVGQVVVFDGLFVNNIPNADYDESKSIGITFSLLAFERITDQVNGYKVIDLKEYLTDKLLSKFNVNLFKDEVVEEVQNETTDFRNALETAYTTKEVYGVFNQYSEILSHYQYDNEKTKELLDNYVDLDNYFENEQNQIIDIVGTAYEAIDAATTQAEIYDAYEGAKEAIDAVKTKFEIISSAIENQSEGYEQYLATYDRVSLSSLNVGEEITYHGSAEERLNDLNTNAMEQQLINTFIPSAENEFGNVVFQFKYSPNAVPVSGANAFVVLRGIPYYGYKFAVDTNSRGCFVEVLNNSSSIFLAGNSNLFVNGNDYTVELGAIDLLHDLNKTWLFMKVNGTYSFSKIVDSLLICSNPRVALSPNGNDDPTNNYPGEVVLSTLDNNLTQCDASYFGSFVYDESQTVSKQNIVLKLDDNALPLDAVAYPLTKSAIKLVRNGETTNIAKTDLGLIRKLTSSNYRLLLSSIVDVQDGDKIIVDGDFAYYDDGVKSAFSIAVSTFQYHEDENVWEPILTLEQTKADLKKKLALYADLSLYDDTEKAMINEIVTNASESIDAAEDIPSAKALFEEAKRQIDAVKTSLDKYKEECIAIVNAYKNDELNKYRTAEQEDITLMKQEAVQEINEATSKEEVAAITVNLKADIDGLKTNEDYLADELEEAKKEATTRVRNHYASLNLNAYSEEEKKALDDDTMKALADIKAATSIAEVNQIADTYINNHAQKGSSGTPSESGKKGCGGSVSAVSLLISLLALSGFSMVLYSKRKKEF